MQMLMMCTSTVFKRQNFKQHTEYGNLQQRQTQTQSHITLAQTITDKKHLNKTCQLHSRFGVATPRDCHSQHRPYIFQQNSIAQNYILKKNSIAHIIFQQNSTLEVGTPGIGDRWEWWSVTPQHGPLYYIGVHDQRKQRNPRGDNQLHP